MPSRRVADLPFLGGSFARERIPDEIRAAGDRGRRREGERDRTRSETLSRIRSFNPSEFAREVAGAQFADLSDEFGARRQGRQADLNRRGLFGSNIGGARERGDFRQRLARSLSRNAFTAAGLEGQNIDRLAGVSALDRREAFNTRGRELELLSGEADREQGRENTIRELRERRAARKQKEGGFFGKLLGGAASFIPVVGDAIDLIDKF